MVIRLNFRWKLFFGFLFFAVAIAILIAGFVFVALQSDIPPVPGGGVSPSVGSGSPTVMPSPVEIAYRRGLLITLVEVLGICLIAALPTAFFIASRLNRPVTRMHGVIEEVERGNLSARVKAVRSYDEFEPLVEHFNAMLDALGEREQLKVSLAEEKTRLDAMRAMRDDLESAVQERTRELSSLAGALRNEVDHHTSTLKLLSDSEARFRSLVTQAPVGIFQTDGEGLVVFVNEFWCWLSGLSAEESSGAGWRDAIHIADRTRVVDELQKAVTEGREFSAEYRLRHRDGRIFWVSGRARPLHDGSGQVVGYLGTATDITEREKAVQERERLFNISLDPVCLADSDGYFKRVNPALERALGFSGEELKARPFIEFVHEDDVDATKAELERLMSGIPTVNFQNRYVCRDGSYRHFEWMVVPIPEEKVGYAIGRDITDSVRAEEAERELFAANLQMKIAHEIMVSLLPTTRPQIPGFDIAVLSQPSETVGGDYYDYIPCADTGVAVIIGDASGHGVSAALLVSQVRACLWSLTRVGDHMVERLLERGNAVLCAGTPDNRFVTLTFVHLNLETRSISYASCGHPTGYVIDRSGAVKATLRSTGPPLGCIPGARFGVSAEIPLECGDLIVLVTDGILEAPAPDEEFFGVERTLEVIRENCDRDAAAIVDALHAAVADFTGTEGPLGDDVTSLVVKVN